MPRVKEKKIWISCLFDMLYIMHQLFDIFTFWQWTQALAAFFFLWTVFGCVVVVLGDIEIDCCVEYFLTVMVAIKNKMYKEEEEEAKKKKRKGLNSWESHFFFF